jgi:hypothetical protein
MDLNQHLSQQPEPSGLQLSSAEREIIQDLNNMSKVEMMSEILCPCIMLSQHNDFLKRMKRKLKDMERNSAICKCSDFQDTITQMNHNY